MSWSASGNGNKEEALAEFRRQLDVSVRFEYLTQKVADSLYEVARGIVNADPDTTADWSIFSSGHLGHHSFGNLRVQQAPKP